MDPILGTFDLIWEVWFIILILGLSALFVALLKFGPRFYARQQKRWLHGYTNRELDAKNADGSERNFKIKNPFYEEKKEEPPDPQKTRIFPAVFPKVQDKK
jgi:hypothetical protein